MLEEVIGIVGFVLIIIGNITIYKSLKVRRNYTYPLLILGGVCMFVYSFFLNDKIFMALQFFYILASIYGLIKIHRRIKK